ncbi:hypothetical protein [Jannaschia sp. R86511]|uniref:hypothetical protein n=1 Tax=Jannaschia sp. R86511 TaxID=3093853 RepID=UPI0036D29AC4
MGTWQDGGGDPASAAERLATVGGDPALTTQTAELLDPKALSATVTVLYPQYGGLTETSASVMTLLTQRLVTADGELEERQSTLDVRLGRATTEDDWAVTAVSPDLDAPAAGEVSVKAQDVLGNPGVRLPGPALRDIQAGGMDEDLLALLDGLGDRRVVDVHVLRTGHPTNVFDTDRPSNHSLGRALDVWRVDGRLVGDPDTPRELLEQVMRDAAALGATEVGGPFDVNGDRPGFFTDAVHQDHIHVGLSEGRSPAQP